MQVDEWVEKPTSHDQLASDETASPGAEDLFQNRHAAVSDPAGQSPLWKSIRSVHRLPNLKDAHLEAFDSWLHEPSG